MDKDKIKSIMINVQGMTCHSCEGIIKRAAEKIDGVISAQADYSEGNCVIDYDATKTDIGRVMKEIEGKGYSCAQAGENQPNGRSDRNNILWLFVFAGALVILFYLSSMVSGGDTLELSQSMSLGLLFIAGLLTGFHCISMCGGFVVGYTAKNAQEGISSWESHIKYGLGKTISYTTIGGAFGLLGSFVAFTPTMRGVAGLLAGMFLVLYGLRMLNVIPSLRKIRIPMPAGLARYIHNESNGSNGPFKIGLMNGLMIACGPLQAIYIMAAGTGSMAQGATMLFVFALGTLPVMLGFGYATSLVSKNMTHKFLKASGAIVILMGLLMMNNGLALTGSGYDLRSVRQTFTNTDLNNAIGDDIAQARSSATAAATPDPGYQEIRMEVNRFGWSPDTFTLKNGVPVKWVIYGKEINGCNNAIQVPKYGLNFKISKGEQVIEFTPTEAGVVPWSCWMGMIPGTFIVTDDGAATGGNRGADNPAAYIGAPTGSAARQAAAPQRTGGCGCGMKAGGTCGMNG